MGFLMFSFFFFFVFHCKTVVGLRGSDLAPRVQPQSALMDPVLLATGFSSVNSLLESRKNGKKWKKK